MRLLKTKTLELCEFDDRQAPPYAILSHTVSPVTRTCNPMNFGGLIVAYSGTRMRSFSKT